MDRWDIQVRPDMSKFDAKLAASAKKARDSFEIKGIKLDIKQAALPLGRITGDFTKFSDSLEAAASRVLAFTATTTAVYGLATAFGRLVSDSIKLEKQLASIQSILQTSSSNLQKFSDDLFNVANATAQSFDIAAEAASEFARQGLTLEDTLKATSAALTFAKIAGIDASQAVENLTASLNTFNNDALEYTDIVDTIVSLDNSFAISAAGIADGLKRVGSVASEAGIELKEVASLISVVQQVSARGAPVISNGLKTIFTRLGRSGVQDALGSIGIETKNANGEFRNQIDVLTDLSNKLDSLSDTQRAFILEQVGGVYQINTLQSTLKALRGEYSLYDKAVTVASDSSGNAEERFKILADTTDANLQKLKNNLTQFFAEIGGVTLKPVVDDFLSSGNSILKGILENIGVDKGNGAAENTGFSIGERIIGGIQSAITGPGFILVVASVGKLFRRLIVDATTAIKVLSGIKSASLADSEMQKAVNKAIEQGNKALVQRLALTTDINEKTALLNALLAQSGAKQRALQVDSLIAVGLAKAKIAPGKASGFVPNFGEISERLGAKEHGYKAGRVYKTRVHDGNGRSELSFVNSAEDVINFVNEKGKKATMVVPPNGFGKGTQVASNYSEGFVPNFNLNFFRDVVGNKKSGSRNIDKKTYDYLIAKYGREFVESQLALIKKGSGRGYSLENEGLRTGFSQYSGGFVPNFSRLERKLAINRDKKRSQLDYTSDGKNLNLTFLKSEQKGDAYSLFNKFVELSARSGLPIKSKSLEFQPNKQNKILGARKAGASKYEQLKLLIPQLRYREMEGLSTSGTLTYFGDTGFKSFDFSSLAELEKLSKRIDSQALLGGGVTIENLTSRYDGDISSISAKNRQISKSRGQKIKFANKGFVPNFVRQSSMIGFGAEGSFHKLTDSLGVKRFHKTQEGFDEQQINQNIKDEYAVGKILSSGYFGESITGPKIEDRLDRVVRAKSIRKEIDKGVLARDGVGRTRSYTFGRVLESELERQGMYAEDLHGKNYTLNEAGIRFISGVDELDSYTLSEEAKARIYEGFKKAGGKASIIDAGFFQPATEEVESLLNNYKTYSKGFVPNFVSKSRLIGKGIEGSFHKLTDDVGVKRFHKNVSFKNIEDEFLLSKLLSEPIVPGIAGPQIPDSFARSGKARSIRKEIIRDRLAADAIDSIPAIVFGEVLEGKMYDAGIRMRDLHGRNYTLNEEGVRFIKTNLGDLDSGNEEEFYRRFVEAGGKATIIDAGYSEVKSPDLLDKIHGYKSYSNGLIPNFSFDDQFTPPETKRKDVLRDIIKANRKSFDSKSIKLYRGTSRKRDPFAQRDYESILKGESLDKTFLKEDLYTLFDQHRNNPLGDAVSLLKDAENRNNPFFKEIEIGTIKERYKKSLPFVSTSKKYDQAKAFTIQKKEDDRQVATLPFRTSRIITADSYNKLASKYSPKIIKETLLSLTKAKGKRGIGFDLNSFHKDADFDFEEEIAILSKGFVPNFAIDLDAFAGKVVKNKRASDYFSTALRGNVERDDKISSTGYTVEPIIIPDEEFFKEIISRPGDKVVEEKFERLALQVLGPKYGFKPNSTLLGGPSAAVDGYRINDIKSKSISLLEAKSGEWDKRDVSNKFGRFLPENLVKISSELLPLFTEGVPEKHDIISSNNILAVPHIEGSKTQIGTRAGTKRDKQGKEEFYHDPDLESIAKFVQDEKDKEDGKNKKPKSTRDKKSLSPQEEQLLKQLGLLSKGFIPNFSSPALQAAKQREMAAGYERNQIRVGKDNELITPLNPQGIGVFNSDEGSLKEGIRLAKAVGLDPKIKGMSTGFVPNFANKKRNKNKKGKSPRNRRILSENASIQEGFQDYLEEIEEQKQAKIIAANNPFKFFQAPEPPVFRGKAIVNGILRNAAKPAVPTYVKPVPAEGPLIPSGPSVPKRLGVTGLGKGKKGNFVKDLERYIEAAKKTLEEVDGVTKKELEARIKQAENTLKKAKRREFYKGIDKTIPEERLETSVARPQSTFNKFFKGNQSEKAIARRDRLQGSALNVAFGLPAIVGAITGPEEKRSEGGKLAAGVAESIGAGVSAAASFGFTPFGVALGVATTTLGALNKVVELSVSSIDDLKEATDKFVTESESQVQLASSAGAKKFALDDLRNSGASQDKLVKAQTDYLKTISKITDKDLLKTITTETDQTKIIDAISTFTNKKGGEVEAKKAILAVGALRQQADKDRTSGFLGGIGIFNDAQDLSGENFDGILEPLLEQIDKTKLSSEAGSRALKKLEDGSLSLADFFLLFGEQLGMSKDVVKSAAEEFERLNGRFTPASLSNLSKYAGGILKLNKSLQEQSETKELKGIGINFDKIFKSALRNISFDTSVKSFAKTASISTGLSLAEQQLQFDESTGVITAEEANSRKINLQNQKEQSNLANESVKIIENAVEGIFEKVDLKNLTQDQQVKILEAKKGVLTPGSGVDLLDLKNAVVEALGAASNSESLDNIESIMQQSVFQLEQIKVQSADANKLSLDLQRKSLEQDKVLALKKLGSGVLSGEAQKALSRLKGSSPLEEAKLTKEIEKLEKRRALTPSKEEKDKISAQIEDKKIERERSKQRRKELEIQAQGFSDIKIDETALGKAGTRQANAVQADRLISDINKRRGELGFSELFSKTQRGNISSLLKTGENDQAKNIIDQRISTVTSTDSILKELIDSLKTLGGNIKGAFTENQTDLNKSGVFVSDNQVFQASKPNEEVGNRFQDVSNKTSRLTERTFLSGSGQLDLLKQFTDAKKNTDIKTFENASNQLRNILAEKQVLENEKNKSFLLPTDPLKDLKESETINGKLSPFVKLIEDLYQSKNLTPQVLDEQIKTFSEVNSGADFERRVSKIKKAFEKIDLPSLTEKDRNTRLEELKKEESSTRTLVDTVFQRVKPELEKARFLARDPSRSTEFLLNKESRDKAVSIFDQSGDKTLIQIADKINELQSVEKALTTAKPQERNKIEDRFVKMQSDLQEMVLQNIKAIERFKDQISAPFKEDQDKKKAQDKKEDKNPVIESNNKVVESVNALRNSIEKSQETTNEPQTVISRSENVVDVDVNVSGTSLSNEQLNKLKNEIIAVLDEKIRNMVVNKGTVSSKTPPTVAFSPTRNGQISF